MRAGAALLTFALAVALPALPAQELVVGAGAPFKTVTAAIAAARAGSTIRVLAGTYREPTVVIRTPGLRLVGDGWPVLDGEGAHEIVNIRADDVTIQGFVFANTGIAHMEDRAALRVIEAARCTVADNRFRQTLFAVYLQRALDCTIRNNDIVGAGGGESNNGNGVHLWHSTGIRVIGNSITGQRDGIYFEFSRGAVAEDNRSEGNSRYGLHFMFSDSCTYARNAFVANGAGVAVMYSKGITMERNEFRDGRGDVPFRPVRFFALVVEKHPEALVMLRSPVTAVLDAAERVFPVLTPPLADERPLMRPPQ